MRNLINRINEKYEIYPKHSLKNKYKEQLIAVVEDIIPLKYSSKQGKVNNEGSKKKSNKGHFLLELVIYTMICSLALVLITNIVILVSKEYKNSTKERKNYSKLFNVENHIDYLLNKPDILEVNCENGELNIDYLLEDCGLMKENSLQNNRIYLSDGTLKIEYIKSFDQKTKNTLLTEVKDFETSEKGNLIYIYIELEDGEDKVMCYEK